MLRHVRCVRIVSSVWEVPVQKLFSGFFPALKASMMKTPVVAMCLEGVDAIAVVRFITGYTNGRKADPGTIRGDYCMSNQQNIVHASDSPEAAEAELARFFKPEEIYELGDLNLDRLYAVDEN